MSNLPKSLRGAIYVVPRGATITVSNSALVLTSHTMKKAKFFVRKDMLTEAGAQGLIYPLFLLEEEKVTVTQLLDRGYYTFETGDATWPWLVVRKTLFEVMNKPGSDSIGGQGKAWDH